MPTPRPETLVTVCAVENPGWKIRFSASRSLSFSACSERSKPFLDRLLFHPRNVDARAVVADFNVDLPAFVIGAQGEPALRWLAGLYADLRRLDAVVARVANQVHERVFDGLDDGAVEFGVGAVHLQANLLAEAHRHVAHHARQLVPDHADGLHARLHDALLQLGGDQVQALRSGVESRIFPLGVELEDLVAGQHQLADQVHQLVQQPHADADIGIGHGGRFQARSLRVSASRVSRWRLSRPQVRAERRRLHPGCAGSAGL